MNKFKEMDIRCPICHTEEESILTMYIDKYGTTLGCNNCIGEYSFSEYEQRLKEKRKSDYESYIIDKGMRKV